MRRFRGSVAAVQARAGLWVLWVSMCWAAPSPVWAQETWLLDMELDVGLPVSDPQLDLFGVGGTASLGVFRTLASWVSLGARVRTGLFLEGDEVQVPGVEDPGLGNLNMLEGALRVRLPDGSARRATGGWIELNGGGGFTGTKLRPALGAGLGWGFRVGDGFALGPHVRYLQILEKKGGLEPRDARLVLAGVSFTALDEVPPSPAEPPPPPDRDGDSVPDALDSCPDDPEDADGFEDADGCPEDDNDGDGILDVDDGCPNIAEDEDGFQDADGCLDDDNDHDGILDALDQCPLEPETVNGVEDEDGCPDKGLIEMHDDRIVLEERVLFDTNHARVRHRGWPVLRAIVELASQHPEWAKVRIEGHADVRGDADFNQRLSERRAANVREMLVEFGMDPSLLVAEGFGASRPRTEETTEEAHRKNRRVEFVVIATYNQPPPADPEKGGLPPLEDEADGGGEAEADGGDPASEQDAEPASGSAGEEAP